MGQKKLERFGRYLLLDHIADGGMAKICRARYLGEQADKIVTIKMVQPQYSQDESFKTMFMDEIKVTFGLLHPNIVQTYEYGYHNGQLYVAMEYCDGRNLKEYLDKLKERKFVFPVEISVYIITQICQGLHYAHTLTDKLSGKEYNIIHRDISPHNLMLTFDGAIKVIDFGIAKADTNSEATQAGTIKGKLSYLAPEYLEGKQLDGRYDQFAVGITLWEMLCSRKLFKANNDLAVLKKIQECKIPAPSSINPNVPKELDDIVLKSLHRDRNKRYENMDQMNRALIKFLYSNYPDFNSTDLSYFAKELFKEEIKKDREKLFEYGKIDLKPYLDDLNGEGNLSNSSSSDEFREVTESGISSNVAKSEGTRTQNRMIDFGFDEDGEVTKTKNGTRILDRKKVLSRGRVKSPSRIDIAKDGTKESSLALGNAPKRRSRSQMAGTNITGKTKTSINSNRHTHSTRTNISKKTKYTKKKSNIVQIAASILIVVGALFYFDVLNLKGPKVASVDEEKKQRLPSSSKKADKKEGTIIIEGFNKYKQKVYLNGKPYTPGLFGEIKNVPFGDYVIRIETRGFDHYVVKRQMNSKNVEQKITLPKDLESRSYGFLTTPYNCTKGKIIFELFNEKRKEMIPFSDKGGIAFPLDKNKKGNSVPTHITVYFQKDGEQIKRKVNFTLKYENDSKDFCQLIL